jgi:hypothetical protein
VSRPPLPLLSPSLFLSLVCARHTRFCVCAARKYLYPYKMYEYRMFIICAFFQPRTMICRPALLDPGRLSSLWAGSQRTAPPLPPLPPSASPSLSISAPLPLTLFVPLSGQALCGIRRRQGLRRPGKPPMPPPRSSRRRLHASHAQEEPAFNYMHTRNRVRT